MFSQIYLFPNPKHGSRSNEGVNHLAPTQDHDFAELWKSQG
jgi:hypothetical protein